MLKVLWIAPFPYDSLRGEGPNKRHPAPWVAELAREISKETELTIANWSKRANGVEEFDKNGIHFIFANSPRLRYDLLTLYRSRINRLADYLEKSGLKFDVIHVHGTEHQYEKVAQRLGIPFVISIQGILNLCRPFYPHRLNAVYASWALSSIYERSGIKKSKNFFCRTKWDSEYVISHNPDAKIFHNWELIRNEFFADNYDEKNNNLLFLGGTNHFKGFKEALRCLDVLKKRGYDMKLRICGNGTKEEVVRFLKTDHLNIPPQDIEFLGFQSAQQLANLFKDSFCMIHPSYMDNSPNSICESQISGLPVIASKVGGVSSLIKNEVTGLFASRYDHVGLTDQVCRLLNDMNLYRTISSNSKNVARKRHNREKIVGNTLKTYNELIRN